MGAGVRAPEFPPRPPPAPPLPTRGLYNGEAAGWGRRTPGRTASERRGVRAAWGPEGAGHFPTWPCVRRAAPSPRAPGGVGPAASVWAALVTPPPHPLHPQAPLWDTPP